MKRILRIVGAATVLGGFVTVGVGERAIGLPVSRVAVVAIGLLSLLVGLWFVADRRLRDAERARPPDTEQGYRVPTPGDRIDRAVERRGSTRTVEQRLVERVCVSLQERGLSRDEAEAAVERGTWTDDRVAAAFLASDGPSVPLAARLRWLLRGHSYVERGTNRTVAALEKLREGSPRE